MNDDDCARIDYSGSTLLSPERELMLGKIILAGRRAQQRLQRNKTLSARDKRKLRDQVKQAVVAIDELVNANVRLVKWQAGKYTTFSPDDLIQEGMVGLMTAVHRWDYRRGRFTTYATWWVRQALSRAVINVDNLVRLPAHAPTTRKAALARVETAKQQSGRNLSMRELASETGIRREQLEAYLRMYAPICSLDAPITHDSDTELGEILSTVHMNSGVLDFAGEVEAFESRPKILAMIDQLPPKVASVMKDYFGFTTGESMTLEEIGRDRRLTRERIRQLVATGVSYLRHPARRQRIGELLGASLSHGE
jgi:RNA polymerase sigma factor (sigma-70 family)